MIDQKGADFYDKVTLILYSCITSHVTPPHPFGFHHEKPFPHKTER